MFFNKLSSRERMVFAAAILVGFIAIFDRLVFKPIVSQFKSLNSDILFKEKGVEKNLRILAQRGRIEKQHVRYSNYAQFQGSDEEEIARLLNEIEGLARKRDVYISDIKPRTSKKKGFYRKYFVEVECEAEIETIIRFMYDLHLSPQLLRVEKFRLSVKAREPKIIKAYYYITETVIP